MGMITTCEQYVVARVQDLENENEKLQARLEQAHATAAKMAMQYEELLQTIQSVTRLDKTSEGEYYIRFDSIWEKYEAEQFYHLREVFKLDDVTPKEDDEDGDE